MEERSEFGEQAPRVSVVMIFRDPGRFFREAIDSVLAQTFTDLELILHDDGSTDGSSGLAERVSVEHPGRVRYVAHPDHAHRGTGPTRDAALREARGELVAFLDADDRWAPDALARQVGYLDAHPDAAMVVGATRYWREWEPDQGRIDEVYQPGPAGVMAGPGLGLDLVNGTIRAPSLNAVVVRRAVLEEVGGFDEAFDGLYEDQALYFKVFLAYPVVFHRQVIDRYRQHDASLYARGLASGFDRIDEPSPARDAFVCFAQEYVRTHGARVLPSKDARRSVVRALRRVATTAGPDRRSLARVHRQLSGGLGHRVRRRLALRRPSPLGRLLPPDPVSWQYGFDRGRPVDRRYIEDFLADHSSDIRGRVLEIGASTYTRRFGGERVDRVDVLHVDASNDQATIVADLADAPEIPDATFDCVILCQTLHLIYDVHAAVATLRRILRPGGVLLLTVPGLSQLTDQEGWGHYWSFTDRSVRRMLEDHFGDVSIHVLGNIRTATAFLYGLADDELPDDAYGRVDRRYPVIVAARAWKSVVSGASNVR